MTQPDSSNILAAHVAAAQQLIVSAGMVGDADDCDVWRWRCKEWNTSLTGALRHLYGDVAAARLRQAVIAAPHVGSWQQQLRNALDGVTQTIQLIQDLAAASAGEPVAHGRDRQTPSETSPSRVLGEPSWA